MKRLGPVRAQEFMVPSRDGVLTIGECVVQSVAAANKPFAFLKQAEEATNVGVIGTRPHLQIELGTLRSAMPRVPKDNRLFYPRWLSQSYQMARLKAYSKRARKLKQSTMARGLEDKRLRINRAILILPLSSHRSYQRHR